MLMPGARGHCQSRLIARAVEEGLYPHAVLLGEDICTQRGPMLSPAFMERFYQLALAANRPAQALWQTQREFLAPTASDDDAFEAAVLRYSPFVIGQNTALESSGEIIAAPARAGFPWRIFWLGLPLAAFFAARVLAKRAA